MPIRALLPCVLTLALAACGDDSSPMDAGLDAGGDGGRPSPDGDSTPDAGQALRLLSSTPDHEADDVRILAPVTLTFSEPIEPASVTDASVVVTTGSGPVERAATVDGERITLELTPPVLDARITVTVTTAVTGSTGARLPDDAVVSFDAPLWWAPGGDDAVASDATTALVAFDGEGRALVATLGDAVRVHRFEDGAWVALGAAMGAGAEALGLETGEDGTAFVMWLAGGDVEVRTWSGASWDAVGGAPAATAAEAPAHLAVGRAGPVVSFARGADVVVRALDGAAWGPETDPLPEAAAGHSLAVEGATVWIARPTDTGLSVSIWDGAWTGAGDLWYGGRATSGVVAPGGGRALVAWTESGHAFASWLSGAIEPIGHAIETDVHADARVLDARIEGDVPVVVFAEAGRLRVTRFEDGRWVGLGGPLEADVAAPPAGAALAFDARGNPVVAFAQPGGAFVRWYNDSPEPTYGFIDVGPGPCVIPEDDDPAFPATLTDTGCYADLSRQILAAGVIPYDLRSPLWSDGAYKRRFIVLPEGRTITPTDDSAWIVPVGTILIKEFYLERTPGDPDSRFPVETRFLVRRCEEGACDASWQGYSYQWNAEGTDGVVLDNEVSTRLVEWDVAGGTHEHGYPGRFECTRCHNGSVGRVLGLQTFQLDRNVVYDGGVVDDQLRAMAHAGVFDDGASPSRRELPRPPDPSYTLEERARAYLHANCSHCHNPDSFEAGTSTSFLYDSPMEAGGNICNRIEPGDADASWLFDKDRTRFPDTPAFGGAPMPPIASTLPDEEQLAITRAWIESMATCP